METLMRTAAGLMVLGLGFAVIDFFLAKLLLKMYPDPNYWTEELSSPSLTQKQRRSLEQRQRLYQNGISHRFRKWGIALFLIGGLVLAASALVHVLK